MQLTPAWVFWLAGAIDVAWVALELWLLWKDRR